MTVPNIEPKNQVQDEHVATAEDGVSSTVFHSKKEFIKKKYHHNNNNSNSNSNKYNSNNNRMRTSYNKYNNNTRDDYSRYYSNQQQKPDYPMPYVYYYPTTAMYYPPIDNNINTSIATSTNIIPTTRDEENLEIVVHDESMNNVSSVDTRSSSSDQSKYHADIPINDLNNSYYEYR